MGCTPHVRFHSLPWLTARLAWKSSSFMLAHRAVVAFVLMCVKGCLRAILICPLRENLATRPGLIKARMREHSATNNGCGSHVMRGRATSFYTRASIPVLQAALGTERARGWHGCVWHWHTPFSAKPRTVASPQKPICTGDTFASVTPFGACSALRFCATDRYTL